ncbi:glycoside hydrolase family 19 protein [Rhodovulum sp. DZ06]|uniref:glycoside hydrolase family 19 protein n=1 Tax=Rhodovulum sp. DZ06 TaxID=3425126 RepID=UPI003D34BB3A
MSTAPLSFDPSAVLPRGLRAALSRAGAALARVLGPALAPSRRGAEAGAAPARAARAAAEAADAAPARAQDDDRPDAPRPATGPTRLLSAGVGPRRRNLRRDVAMVQRLINAAAAAGALPAMAGGLAVDGRWGPRTAVSLSMAQIALTGGRDGAADAGGVLIGALMAAALPRGPSMQLLRLLWPSAPAARLERLGPKLLAMMDRRGLSEELRAAHFLAQVGHESGQLRWLEELASGSAYEGRADLGNDRPGDGPRFKGRGLIQLTGRANYARFGAAMGCKAELLADPALAAQDPCLSVETAGWFWDDAGLSRLADRDDLRGITLRINGGLTGLVERGAMLTRAKALLGI